MVVEKGLYGLRQAGHNWHEHLKEFLMKTRRPKAGPNSTWEFRRSDADPCVFIHGDISDPSKPFMMITVYVDDLIIAHNSQALFDGFKTDLFTEYKCTYLGKLHWYLGMEVKVPPK